MPNQPDLPKAYEPQKVEENIYSAWEASGFFNPDNLPDLEKRQEPFSIVLPPPNRTGILHLGHAAMLGIEDAMVRFARMRGKRALWVPGTDHAAIATQTKVEKELMKAGMKDPRRELGREKFLEEVRAFAEKSHDTIVHQVKKMGASLDWSREAYTLDEARNKAVNTVFKMMYDDGLIYRGHRVVNWCPRCKSTLADDELVYKEEKGKMYWIKYGPFVLATSRPETKLGDTAVAVHPDDERYKDMVGKKFMIPGVLGEFEITVVADEAVDPNFGTGAVKVTPFHSMVDFEIAQRHGIEGKQIINEEGRMMDNCGKYAGMTTLEAREAVVADMEKMGLMDHIDDNYDHSLALCYRCETVVEPLPKLQWFIGVNRPFKFRASTHAPIEGIKNGQEVTLKQLMQHVVRTNQIKIIPDQFNSTYFHWIDNLRDWNISRQIWFGHPVPVWYRGDEISVGSEAPGADWQHDEDTLDTWFSSGLWTFSTLGWPDKTKDFELYHPTTVMETGYDILFFWVARMILMTTYTLGEIPFKTVYLHGLIRDANGKKMSKSAGNAIDPLEMVEKYGADATRLSLVIGTSPGNDFKMYEEKIAGFRNFTNKLWNIARFVLTTVGEGKGIEGREGEGKTLADRWILTRLSEITSRVTELFEKHELSAVGEILREFTWSDFADWYIEISKVQKKNPDFVASTDTVLVYVLETLVRLWHPLMPFVTEEIWIQMGKGQLLMVEEWPEVKAAETDVRPFARLKEIVEKIRNWRAENKVEPKEKINLILSVGEYLEVFDEANLEIIKTLARVENLKLETSQGFDYQFKVDRQIDTGKEKDRLSKELAEIEKYLVDLDNKLSNNEFISKAPAQVVEAMKQKQAEAAKKAEAIKQQLSSL